MTSPDYQKALGRRIASERRRRGLSQPELVRMIDRSVAWVSQVERGVRKVDRMSVLENVAAALDIRPVTSAGELTDNTVAGYVAKYATKAAECTGTLDRRITPADRLDELPIRDHARRHIAECLRLGRLPQFADLRLSA